MIEFAIFTGLLFLLCAAVLGMRLKAAPTRFHAVRVGAFLTPWILLFGLACLAAIYSIRDNRGLPTEKILVERIRATTLKNDRAAVLSSLLANGLTPALQDGADYQEQLKSAKELAREYAKAYAGEYGNDRQPFSVADLDRSTSSISLFTGYIQSEREELLNFPTRLRAELLFDAQGHFIAWHYEGYTIGL